MLLIPAIDLKGGKCVRLRQGRMEEETVFGDDPVAMAKHWVELGAKRLHIVDLDGAVRGQPQHLDVIAKIRKAIPEEVELQVGGGVRDEETIQELLNRGVDYVVLGTQAIRDPFFVKEVAPEFPGHILVGLDAKGDRAATDGWSKLSRHKVIDLAKRFEAEGAEAIIYTDIERDGMLSGPNTQAVAKLAEAISIPVIASGGVRSLDDVRALGQLVTLGVMGAITGRAIYEGTLDFKEAVKLAEQF